ncbi:MAG: creatininase family protein [Betaproteobacteria bacterium]|nr:creatininase family protein [Betaproteobacteria bacterium]
MVEFAFSWRRGIAALALLVSPLLTLASPVNPPEQSSVYLEELTSPELRALIASGTTTALVPIGGTEQNGPHMVLGKHNVRVRILAGAIARQLGHAVVAPVIAYVPEGTIDPPAAHMRYAGTLSVSGQAFEAVLEGAARSLKQHGFRHVVFVGDHGGYQKLETRVAERLNRQWAGHSPCRAHALTAYYDAAQEPFSADLEKHGFSAAQIGTHAGLADTALALAVDPALVRPGAQASAMPDAAGVHGDPRPATAALGEPGVRQIVETSVKAIRAMTAADDRTPELNTPRR